MKNMAQIQIIGIVVLIKNKQLPHRSQKHMRYGLHNATNQDKIKISPLIRFGKIMINLIQIILAFQSLKNTFH